MSGAAALASHRRKIHSVCSLGSRLGNFSSCPRCMVEFWSARRLWDHLRKQAACRAAFEACAFVSHLTGLEFPEEEENS